MTSKILIAAIFLIIFLSIAQRKNWIDLTSKDRPSMQGTIGIFDEIFSPGRHQAIVQIKEKRELRAEVFNEDSNVIHIDLEKR